MGEDGSAHSLSAAAAPPLSLFAVAPQEQQPPERDLQQTGRKIRFPLLPALLSCLFLLPFFFSSPCSSAASLLPPAADGAATGLRRKY